MKDKTTKDHPCAVVWVPYPYDMDRFTPFLITHASSLTILAGQKQFFYKFDSTRPVKVMWNHSKQIKFLGSWSLVGLSVSLTVFSVQQLCLAQWLHWFP